MLKLLGNFWADERGATVVEYGLIASLVSVAAISAFSTTGAKLSATFKFVAGQLNT